MSTPALAQQIEGLLGAAAFEEAEVVVEFLFAAVDDALAECDGGAEAGGVFVDVERAVEMGDAEAFQFEFGVDARNRGRSRDPAVCGIRLRRVSTVSGSPASTRAWVIFSNSANIVWRMIVPRMPSICAVDQVGPFLVRSSPCAIMCRARSCSLNVLATSATKIV